MEERHWVPESGWPFEIGELAPYLDRTALYLGLAVGSGFSEERFWIIAGRTPQRAEKLLNCAAWLSEVVAPDDLWNALRRVLGGKPQLPGYALAIALNAGYLVRGLKDYFVERNGIPPSLKH